MTSFVRPDAGIVGRMLSRLWRAFAGSPRAPALLDAPGRRFGSFAGHEMNNLLSAVLLAADIVAQADGLDEARAAAIAISAAAQAALDLTSRVTALVRADDLAAAPCDLTATLAMSRPRLERAAGGAKQFHLDLPESTLPALVDRDQFLACMVEMVIDARTENVHGQVFARVGLADPPVAGAGHASWAVIEVEGARADDDASPTEGPALPDELRRAVIGSFARQSHGVFDRTASGTQRSASLRLPLVQTGEAFSRATPAQTRRIRLPSAVRVVVVEDNEVLRGVLVSGLKAHGLEAAEARHAVEARTMIAAGATVLITDVVMPGDMDGLALARWARERDPRIVLLFVSAFMTAKLPQVLASDELASFLRKPFDMEGLLVVLDGLLAVRDEQGIASG